MMLLLLEKWDYADSIKRPGGGAGHDQMRVVA
jgi:hypothetical protein